MEKEIIELHYEDKELIKIEFTVLITRVESINKKFGSLHDFVNKYELYGYTNGKLFIIQEMMIPPPYLYSLINEVLTPLGFKDKKDFVLTFDRLVQSGDLDKEECHLLGKEIPECMNVDWLRSIITRKGNFVWYKSHKKRNLDN